MVSRLRMAAILFLSVAWLSVCSGCSVDDVAVYKVKLNMLWTDTFKDYPTNSQWSKVFGQSHNKSYTVYRIGEVARSLVRDFAQFATLDQMMEEGDEDPKVYDQFLAPALKKETGETENLMFTDGGHSLVSLICRMIPSPDWFIGVDSLDLCVDSSWVDQVTLDLEPLDAGAVDGVTFNQEIPWPSKPIQTVERVSLRNPDSGFSVHHHNLRHNLAIATVEFTKIKEYSTKELNDLARKELLSNVKSNGKFKDFSKIERNQDYYENYDSEETIKSEVDQLKDLEEEPVGTPTPNQPVNNVVIVTKAPRLSEEEIDEDLKNMDDVVLAVATGHKLGLGKHLPRHFKSRLHHAVNRNHHNDCTVSEWSKWSDCTDSCSGSGEMVRLRSIIRAKKRGGRDCPSLIEKKPCGHHCRGDDFGW